MSQLLKYIREKVRQNYGKFNPIIISDIDGVLLRGSTQIPGTLRALHRLKEENIPLACLTNGGGQMQSYKVKKMNDIFGETIFSPQLMFMNHTPVRPHLIKYSKMPGLLLVSGSLKITDILDDIGIKNYVTADELYAIFHEQQLNTANSLDLPFYKRSLNMEDTISKLTERLGKSKVQIPNNYHEWGQIINSIFALNDVCPYQTTLEVIHNIFAEKKKKNLPNPPYFAAQNDIVWAGGYHRPRLAFGPFNFMLEQHCRRHAFELDKCYFGKPEKIAFQFVQNYMKNKFGQGCFFMIGDNPRADIKGANNIGWGSFLTQTGIHHGSSNDPQNPATMLVSNFQQAIETIIKIKKQALYL